MNASQFCSTPHTHRYSNCFLLSSFELGTRDYSKLYNIPGRLYHNWDHITNVRYYANELLYRYRVSGIRFSKENLTALSYAIDIHDLYNTEEASASDIINTSPLAAYIIIMGTTHTKAPTLKLFDLLQIRKPIVNETTELLVNIMHDADLMILAESDSTYDLYAHNILKESMIRYGISAEQYTQNRIPVLKHFIMLAESNQLFKCSSVACSLHSQAIKNLRGEFKRIS